MADGLVPVQILGQRYAIRSALDPRYVQELATYVDEKMRAVADQAAPGDSLRLAVVAALNIADETFRARGADDGHRRDATDRLARIEELIDHALVVIPTVP
jgi:cell division protein ZapA